ncbi:MAG: S8 family serine peptidase [Bacteroidota bacterium]
MENDLPVNSIYVNAIRKYTGAILSRSKWFNGITFYCLNPSLVDSISRLPFVKKVVKNKLCNNNINNYKTDNKFNSEELLLEVNAVLQPSFQGSYNVNNGFNYGPSFNQIHMLKGDSLHKMGYRGQGMVIAILDGGFKNADKLIAFDSLWTNNQILGTKDFVTPGNNVFNESSHGMEVLSCIGGNIPGQLIGTAPKSDFWLLRTEDINSENLIEEYNWVAGAEFADSVGADIINSSLGYTQFDDTTKNHTCADMNGNSTPATKGANLAFSKGMLIVNSAGNEGNKLWKCVSAPADGFNVLAVAAVDSNGIRAVFSSVGEATRRIKPNVASMGVNSVVSSEIGTIIRASGTSFSSPIIAGLVACLWQAAPTWSNYLIKRSIELSGNKTMNPDSLTGYGIPDFVKALKVVSVPENHEGRSISIYPNPFISVFTISFNSVNEQRLNLLLCDQQGRVIYSCKQFVRAGMNEILLTDLPVLKKGFYFLNIKGNDINVNEKVIKIYN